MARAETVLSQRQVEGLIADGKTVIIIDQEVLMVDPWLKYHPGGDKAIKHMVGRDATDEVNAFHSLEARQQMQRYRIGRIEGRWTNFIPPIQGGKFRPYVEGVEDGISELTELEEAASYSSRSPSPVFDEDEGLRQRKAPSSSSASSVVEPDDGISFIDIHTREQIDLDHAKYPSLDITTQGEIVRKYRLLEQRIQNERLYDCNYSAYAIESMRYIFLFSMMLMFLQWGWYSTNAVFLGCLWHRLVFTVHDAGHMGITHNFHVDTLIGIFIADFIVGLSDCWWKHNHNVHHIVTNSPEHNPDIEHVPFFAISPRFLTSLRSTFYDRVMSYDAFAKFLLPYQAYLYYPVLLFGRFNLYALGSISFVVWTLGKAPRGGIGGSKLLAKYSSGPGLGMASSKRPFQLHGAASLAS